MKGAALVEHVDLRPNPEVSHELPDALLRPQAFAHVVAARRVSLEETHISWVFVLDDDVFKLKKPVDFGFLDFRTLEARRTACEAEVRLNRRLAPRVYKEVVPVRIQPSGELALGGTGRVVDWAVHMARMPASRRASELLARGALGRAEVEAVAARIATFHSVCRPTVHFEAIEAVKTNVLENFAQTCGSLASRLTSAEAAELVAWQKTFVAEHAEALKRRFAAGRVRDGHGDLRLEHVYIEPNGEIVVLDCIEFNERFRVADVCADVAFFSMDLASEGRVDLAEAFLAAYARESNDFDLYGVVDFYESYRAFVRGKISLLQGRDADARRYFLLALSSDRKWLVAPSVVAVGGVIASGKSTVAGRIAERLGAPVVEADRTRKSMIGVDAFAPVHEGAWAGAYDPAFTERVYEEVLRRAEVVLASGRSVVVDASFRSPAMRAAARALATRHGVPFHFVECAASLDVCRERLRERERHAGVSDGRLAIFDAFCKRWEPPDEVAASEHLRVDTARPLDETSTELETALATWPRRFDG